MTTQNPATCTILLVEDEPLLRLVLQETLEDSGYRVEEAESGDMAWGLVERGLKFDILLTDVRMPGRLNGLELARKVKANSARTSIIVMSGFVGQAAMESDLGMFLSKPFTPNRLVSAMDAIAGR